ncbi:enoyl-CoA hydratase [Bacillus sp. 28A-2]|uniref:enoyl-CoA hydratase n=1 Tax=Bacillus sp. 28A-2 TaxID=2772252 RepID=UPI00168D6905|nr:enoyl-CoA hydratase [Bacillus sp. 28A-2]MBD3859855.1 enoyl-CoA hydratase [Bacillus sp. 28A-2]
MIKKIAALTLAAGLLVPSTISATEPIQARKAEPAAPAQFTSVAYTTVSIVGKRVKFEVKALENYFNSSYYQRIAWTSNDEEPSVFNDNILSVIVAKKTGQAYQVTSYETLISVKDKIESGQKVYGWALALNGVWYPTMPATLYY